MIGMVFRAEVEDEVPCGCVLEGQESSCHDPQTAVVIKGHGELGCTQLDVVYPQREHPKSSSCMGEKNGKGGCSRGEFQAGASNSGHFKIQGMDVGGRKGSYSHSIGDCWADDLGKDTEFLGGGCKGQLELAAFGANEGFGGLELVGPVQGHGDEGTKVLVRGGGREEGDGDGVDFQSVKQLVS